MQHRLFQTKYLDLSWFDPSLISDTNISWTPSIPIWELQPGTEVYPAPIVISKTMPSDDDGRTIRPLHLDHKHIDFEVEVPLKIWLWYCKPWV